MQLTLDTDNLTPYDKDILRAVLGEGTTGATPAATKAPTANATKTAATKAATPTPSAEVEPATEVAATTGAAPTVDDALAVAGPLISGGKSAVVKRALTDIGVKKVGELKGPQIAEFIAAIEA